MKNLDFNPIKTDKSFKNNYKLHDLAELNGKNLLVQWGINFQKFGDDRRNEKVWEKGEDKPDILIDYLGQKVLVDWKSKKKAKWIVNFRAIKSYENWSKKTGFPIFIVFFVFENEEIVDRRFAVLGVSKYKVVENLQWDKNKTIEFIDDLPIFNASNLIREIRNQKSDQL